MPETNTMFTGKKILVTGGAGSIGSEIVRQLLKHEPDVVRVYDIHEGSHFDLEQQHLSHTNLRFLVGDVRDKDRLDMAMDGINIVFHAAALKHVPMCEYNPFEAIKTNVVGTQNVISSAIENNVHKLINISTDKSSNPSNTMGATKLLAEKLVAAADHYKGSTKTTFSSVRFGNVFASSGSVVPLFIKQIHSGGPVTLTDPDMTRFIMTIEDAVNLVFRASEMSLGGETFILKMPAFRLGDLAEQMIEKYSGESRPEVKLIGIRPGEKMHEELMTGDEALYAFETSDMFIIPPKHKSDAGALAQYAGAAKASIKSYSSNDTVLLSKPELGALLDTL